MSLPPALHKKYVTRFYDLIRDGETVLSTVREEQVVYDEGTPGLGLDRMYEKNIIYDDDAFFEWRSGATTLLETVTRQGSVHTGWVSKFPTLQINQLKEGLAHLRSMKKDFDDGFLVDLLIQVEAEIASDYLGQAEFLLTEGKPGNYDHVPAAVLTGAVLEKALRTLCDGQSPPVPTTKGNGDPKRLGALIDDLKKASAFNEMRAKQLRAWADIRNHAAHGEFEEFDKSDVEQMIAGVTSFIASSIA